MTSRLSISTVLSVLHVLEIPGHPHKVLMFPVEEPKQVERDTTSQNEEAEKPRFEAWLDFRNCRVWRMNFISEVSCMSSDCSTSMDQREIIRVVCCRSEDTPNTDTGAKLQTKLRFFFLKKYQAVSRRSSAETLREESSNKKKLHRKKKATGKQVICTTSAETMLCGLIIQAYWIESSCLTS